MIEQYIKFFGLDVKEIKDVADSNSSTVRLLVLEDDEKVILKIPFSKEKLFREKMILEKLKNHILVPEVLDFFPGQDEIPGALLLSYLDGESLEDDQIDEHMSEQLGELLGKLHLVAVNNYSITNNPSTDWWASIKEKATKWLEEQNGHIDADFMERSRVKLFEMIEDAGEADGPVLVHMDYRPGNILVKNNEIKGLIDFESSRGGSADLDFVKMKVYVWDKNPHLKSFFLRGYQRIRPIPNIEKTLQIYELFNGIGGLAWCIRRDALNSDFFVENYEQVKQFLD